MEEQIEMLKLQIKQLQYENALLKKCFESYCGTDTDLCVVISDFLGERGMGVNNQQQKK